MKNEIPAEIKVSDEDSAALDVAKTTGIVLMGTFANIIFSFFSNVLLVRSLDKADFGVLSLILAVTTIATLLVSSGFNETITRYISLFKSQQDRSGLWTILRLALYWSIISGVIIALLTALLAIPLANILNIQSASFSIGFMALTIPPAVIIIALNAILRGFGDAKGQVIFSNLLSGGTKLVLLLLVFMLGLSYWGVLLTLVLTGFISCLGLGFYTWRKHIRSTIYSEVKPIGKEVLKFSLPLAVHVLTFTLNDWIVLLILGLFRPPEEVALFNVAKSSANYSSLFLYASVFFYLPMATNAITLGNISLLRSTYATITKWTVLVSLPVILLLLLAPETILGVLYKPQYSEAAPTLQILVLGYLFNVLTGLNGHSLIALGRSKELAVCTVVGTSCSIVTSLFLIPVFHEKGAAIAFITSTVIFNVLVSTILFQLVRVKPLPLTLVKTFLVSILSCSILFLVVKLLALDLNWLIIPLLPGFTLLILLSAVITRSISPTDLLLIESIERRLKVPKVFSTAFSRFLNQAGN